MLGYVPLCSLAYILSNISCHEYHPTSWYPLAAHTLVEWLTLSQSQLLMTHPCACMCWSPGMLISVGSRSLGGEKEIPLTHDSGIAYVNILTYHYIITFS
jgi:hypothetical protein